jgi:transketolase
MRASAAGANADRRAPALPAARCTRGRRLRYDGRAFPLSATSGASSVSDDLDLLAVNTVRALAMDAVEAAQSGHPGTPMALAPLAYVLWTRHLAHNPADPHWPNRDRFVLSAGHASMLLYGLLHLTGYDLGLEDIRNFRQLGYRTPGHPESFVTPGVETTTGPLGQGLGNAVGMALAEAMLAARYNRPGHEVIDHRTWVIVSDGDMMEGVGSEASSLAGHLGLGKLVVCWDDNRITIDGRTDLAFSAEDVETRYRAYGWRTLTIDDVNDLGEVDRVLKEAAAGDGRPTFVRVRSVIGWPAPTKQDTAAAHGAPLGPEEVAAAKAALGWEHPEFAVPADARAHADQRERGAALQVRWHERVAAYRVEHPDLATELERVLEGRLPAAWAADLPAFEVGASLATRKASGEVINALAGRVPELVGGSADLASSNNTDIAGGGDVARADYTGRNIRFGVREHAMAAMMNGMALHGGLRPFGGSFLVFTDYARPSIRLAALMSLPVVYVMTHDSVGLGEDGPTHQPVEQLAALRAVPNLHVMRPADATETVGAWRHALTRTDGPTVLALTRQGVPVLAGTAAEAVAAGGYAVVQADDPDVVIVATGSEVAIAVEAAAILADDGITARVVSLPCWELLEARDGAEQDALLPADVPVLSVEAATSFGWSRWADSHVALDRYGASAPWKDLYEHFGFTAAAVAAAARDLCED